MKKEMMENATGVKLTKKASKNVIRSLSVGLAAMMALSTPIAAFAEDADGQNSSETTPEESTTTVTTRKTAADQVKEIQQSDAAQNVKTDTNAAKDAVNAAVDTTFADGSGADQTTKGAAGELDTTANGTFEGGTDVNVAEEMVDKTMDRIDEASDAAAKTDAALKEADQKADEANTIADDAKKEQQEAQDAFDKAQAGIDSATDIEEAKNAYNQAAGIVGDAQKAYETAKAAYDSKVAEYNTALDELKAAQEAYDTAVAAASAEATAAAANLAAVQQKAESLQKAAEEAKTAIPELTDAQKAALEIIALEKERTGDTSTNWRKEDELFKVILKNYYIPELAKGELVDCKWTWNRNDNKNYCEVTYKDVAGDTQTVYLNYKLNGTRDDLVIFRKAEEVVSYDVKGTDGSLAFNINAENFPADKLQNDQDTAVYENNGVVYTIVNIGGQFYVVDSASTDVEVNNNYNSEQYEITGEKKTTYSVDENGKLVKTVKQNVSEITYTQAGLSSDKTYDSVEAAEKDLADKKATLKDGDKDVETSMSATATANVTVSQKTIFTTTIDLSKIVVEMEKINNDNDKYEKENAKIAATELFAKFTNKEALENLLGGDYKIESINKDNAKVNATDQYKNTSGRLVDWFADSASYENVFSGTIIITYSQTVTAKKENVERSYTNAVNATDNKNLEELKGQAYDAAKADAEKLLRDAVSQNKKIKDNLKDGELHINGYVNKKGKMDSNVAIKIHYADDTFTEGKKTTDQAVVDEKNSSTTLSVSYTGTYQQKNSKDLGAQTVETQKYNQTAKAEEKTAYTSNKYYDEYKKTGKINEGIWLTGKDDDRFPGHESLKSFYDFKDAALKAEAERAEKVAKADAIINAAKNAVEKVNTAKNDADSLKEQLTALLASQNYTADQVKELEGQISAAEIKLKEAEDMAKDLTDKLGIAGETLADKITELTPAPAPGEGGSTTTPGGATTPSGTETTPGGAATTSAGTVTTAAAPASAATIVTTATADAAPVQIAETPVALAAAATPAAVTRTAAVANANAAADADTDVTIADEETPLAANGAQESTTIADEETPLAAEAGAVENKQQEKMSWWWLLIIALLGVTGEEMYRRNKKKKAEAAQKDEK
ncbi:hypothetical protein [Roseburia inulinivorans]|uniref:hypothetical protein n=1 Tax=Roseburia inulinivorans TaxID=360807 RepID=UPI002672C131|nr:hypothetical protein [Roseburia inulinivorans]